MPFDLSSKETRLNLSLLLGSLLVGYLIVRAVVPLFQPRPEKDLFHLAEKDAETLRALVTEEAPGIYRPVPDPDIGYLLQRDILKPAFGMLVRTNQAGLRGATIEEKAPGALRVVCLGDSMTFGYKVEEQEAFPSQLRTILAEGVSQPIEVVNCAVPSWNLRSEAHFLRSRLDKLRPDLVIWQIHDNDLGATLGVAEGGFATRDFSPQERELGESYFTGQSALASKSLSERLHRAREEIADLVHLLARERIGLVLFFISDKQAMLAHYTTSFAQRFPDLPALVQPDRYLAQEYRLPSDPHFSPEGNRLIAAALAWVTAQHLDQSTRGLPPLPEGYNLETTVGQLAASLDNEALQTEEWKSVPPVFVPHDETCQRLSTGVMKFGWVAMNAEFPLPVPASASGTLRLEGEFLQYPQITPLRVTFEIGDSTHTETLVDKGDFTFEIPVPSPRGGPEEKHGGLMVRCRADKYSSALDDPRRLSWVMKRAEFVPKP